ncbi:MAG: hypothetical protein ACI4EN_06605 [Butyrivibrio sp.]
MLFEELMKEEYNAGKAEGVKLGKAETMENARTVLTKLLCEIAPVTDNLKERISSIKELEDVMQLTIKAAKADTLEAFENELKKMGY